MGRIKGGHALGVDGLTAVKAAIFLTML